jgi:hypothetical protein
MFWLIFIKNHKLNPPQLLLCIKNPDYENYMVKGNLHCVQRVNFNNLFFNLQQINISTVMEITFIQLTKDELIKIINEAVNASLSSLPKESATPTFIKGIHALAHYLKVSPVRAQKLKNDGVLPYFQNGRLVLFDSEKVRKAMEYYNQNKINVK